MGYSLPAAMGAKAAAPKRQVVCICGDGSFQMMLQELATISQNDLDVKIIVMRNDCLGLVREYQNAFTRAISPLCSCTRCPISRPSAWLTTSRPFC